MVPYFYGSDARKIDAKATAKTGELHIKLFFEEREANIVLVDLLSATMEFEGKMETAKRLHNSLATQVLNTQNPLTQIALYGDEKLVVGGSKDKGSVEFFAKKRDEIELRRSRLDYKLITKQIASVVKRESFIILIGDFLDEVDLGALAKKHEIYLFIVRSSFEEHPKPLAEGEFVDLESGESRELFFGKKEAKLYKKRIKEHDEKLHRHFKKHGIGFEKMVA